MGFETKDTPAVPEGVSDVGEDAQQVGDNLIDAAGSALDSNDVLKPFEGFSEEDKTKIYMGGAEKIETDSDGGITTINYKKDAAVRIDDGSTGKVEFGVEEKIRHDEFTGVKVTTEKYKGRNMAIITLGRSDGSKRVIRSSIEAN